MQPLRAPGGPSRTVACSERQFSAPPSNVAVSGVTTLPTPSRSAATTATATASVQSMQGGLGGDEPASDAPQPSNRVRDVGLRLKGMQRMEVRGRRRPREAEGPCAAESGVRTETGPAVKRLCSNEAVGGQSGSAAAGSASGGATAASPSEEDEVVRWVKVAPQAAYKTFKSGPEAVLRRLAKQPAHKVKMVMQSCSRRRAEGDRDVDVLTWMEGFLVAILAKGFGVHVRMTLEGPVNVAESACPAEEDDVVQIVGENFVIPPSTALARHGEAPAMAKPAALLRAPSWGAGAAPRQTLRISAGRAAVAAGIHPYADVGEFFLEMVYQDLPELLLKDAALVEVEIVSKQDERERLLAKSGEASKIEEVIKEGAASVSLEGIRKARDAVGVFLHAAEQAQRLTAEEAAQLRNVLESELNLEFGARHEDTAIAAYEAAVAMPVYGDQHRIKVAMPCGGPAEALRHSFPPTGSGCRKHIEAKAAAAAAERAAREAKDAAPAVGSDPSSASGVGGRHSRQDVDDKPYFLLTGFTDGIVDVPKNVCAPVRGRPTLAQQLKRLPQELPPAVQAQELETLVVEVKHRMGRIQDPPNIYDVVQLCCYCRVLGCARGDLVQCLRDNTGADSAVGELCVTRIDFSEGSHHREGFDKHILPGMYEVARAVYAVRDDEGARLRLLAAAPEERIQLVGCLCPHLQK